MNFYHLDVLAYHVELALGADPSIGQLALPHKLYTYKTVNDNTGEAPMLETPFVMIGPARQTGAVGVPRGFSYQHPHVEQTRAAIWIGSPLTLEQDDGTRVGAFDAIHHPAFKRIKELIRLNQSLKIPDELVAEYKAGYVGLRMDPITGEDHQRIVAKQMERSVLFAILYQHKTGGS